MTAPERGEHAPGRAWRRLLLPHGPGSGRGQAVVALVCLLLGFAVAVQVRSRDAAPLTTASSEQLIGILDDLGARSDRLRAEQADLERTRDQLVSGRDTAAAALADARERARTLGILAGTLPATGPGIVLTITDPDREIKAALVLDAVEELRDAGAEALQVGDVRVVASTAFVDGADGTLVVDGTTVPRPYVLRAIGDTSTLQPALGIPGGVLDTVRRSGSATASVREQQTVQVTALRPLPSPQYARPAPTPTP